MKLLEKIFVSGEGGYSQDPLTYTLVKRSNKAAIYKRSLNGRVKDFEVFEIKIRPKGTKIFKKISEEDEELYPSASQFGFIAWSYKNLTAAENCFDELNKAVIQEAKAEFAIPEEEFTTTELADKNNTNYIIASNFIKNNPDKIKFVREERRNLKGKMTKIFSKK